MLFWHVKESFLCIIAAICEQIFELQKPLQLLEKPREETESIVFAMNERRWTRVRSSTKKPRVSKNQSNSVELVPLQRIVFTWQLSLFVFVLV